MKLKAKQIFIIILSVLVVLNIYKFIRNRERQSVNDIGEFRRSVDSISGFQQQKKEIKNDKDQDVQYENKNAYILKKTSLEEVSNEDKRFERKYDPNVFNDNVENKDYKDEIEEKSDSKDTDLKLYRENVEADEYPGELNENEEDSVNESGDIQVNKKEKEGEEQLAPKRPPQSSSSTITSSAEHTEYDGHDLMQDPKFTFHPNFKNPCWFGENNYGKRTLRCLPYFFIIGVKKCGTSDLFYRITSHPDVIKPGFKEAQFFARSRFRGEAYDDINYYVDKFDPAAQEILNRTKVDKEGVRYNNITITGEASPSNLHLNSHWMHLPGNENLDEPKYVHLDYIHHFLPDAKIIVTFRDPVERLYSDYYHEYGTLMKDNDPSPHQFHDIVTEGLQLYRSCFAKRTVRSCVYDPSLYARTKIQIQLGIFYVFWEDLIRLYPRNQILVLQNKNLKDKENTLNMVFKYLGLREVTKREMLYIVSREEKNTLENHHLRRIPMLRKTQILLQKFYLPFNLKLAMHLGDEAFLYK